jgi:hypothetical protein
VQDCGRGRPPRGRQTLLASGDTGAALVDLIIALTIVLTIGGLAMPATAEVIEASRARQAAGFMASQFRLARLRAVASTRSVGLVFDQVGATWTFRNCTDGNANGLRRSDLGSGQDACTSEVVDVAAMFPGMAIGVDPRLPGPAGEPGSGDPVRFGSSNILSFSATGTCTAGTLFLRSARGTQYAVRISNVTTRTRVLRYEAGLRTWVPV